MCQSWAHAAEALSVMGSEPFVSYLAIRAVFHHYNSTQIKTG
jgi:hypothetical protein